MAVTSHLAGLRTPSPAVTVQLPEIWRERAAEFADEVIAPLGLLLDRMAPGAVSAGVTLLPEFIALATREGFTRLADPIADGGAGLSRVAEYDVLEKLASADAGLAAVLPGIPLPLRVARHGPAQRYRRAEPFPIGEPPQQTGCIVAGGGPFQLWRDGPGWRLNGSATDVTGGRIASHAVIACAAGRQRPGLMAAIVALDRIGVRRQASTPSPGLRGRIPSRLVFDHVRVDADEVLGERYGGDRVAASLQAIDDLSAAVGFIGVACAAYDGAARWRAERGLEAARRLARMRGELEIARRSVRAAHGGEYGRLDVGEAMHAPHARRARALASRTAISLARSAIELCDADAHAADGVPQLDGTHFHPAKLLRDATAGSLASPGRIRPAAATAAQPLRMGSTRWATSRTLKRSPESNTR